MGVETAREGEGYLAGCRAGSLTLSQVILICIGSSSVYKSSCLLPPGLCLRGATNTPIPVHSCFVKDGCLVLSGLMKSSLPAV